MAIKTKAYIAILLMVLLASGAISQEINAGGPCGRRPIGSAAASMAPCLGAARSPRGRVPPACCARVNALIRSAPRCLCGVLLSPLAKRAGINPAVAIGIPKRCNIRSRHAGKRCGRYVVP